MPVSYPSNPPSGYPGLRSIMVVDREGAELAESPFSFAAQSFTGPQAWALRLSFVPMERAEAAAWIAWRKSLYGTAGYFEMALDPQNVTPQGTWALLSPKANGAHAAEVTTLSLKNVPDGTTWKGLDLFQVLDGSIKRVHQVVQDGAMVGSPSEGYVEFWPPLRAALADGATLDVTSPVGTFRLAPGNGNWTLDPDMGFVLPDLDVVEYL